MPVGNPGQFTVDPNTGKVTFHFKGTIEAEGGTFKGEVLAEAFHMIVYPWSENGQVSNTIRWVHSDTGQILTHLTRSAEGALRLADVSAVYIEAGGHVIPLLDLDGRSNTLRFESGPANPNRPFGHMRDHRIEYGVSGLVPAQHYLDVTHGLERLPKIAQLTPYAVGQNAATPNYDFQTAAVMRIYNPNAFNYQCAYTVIG